MGFLATPHLICNAKTEKAILMRVLKSIERSAKKLVPDKWRKYFRASRYELLMERVAPVEVIVHVGAHWGEDAAFYEACGAQTVLWIEADPDTYKTLTERLTERSGDTRHLSECALVSAEAGAELAFHRFKGDGSSSSVHQAAPEMSERFPDAGESGDVLRLQSRALPDILARHDIDLREATRPMLVVDVQGHEFEVLKGLGAGLATFALCKCEVSRIPLYQGGATFDEIDGHMRAQGFRLASHRYVQVPRHGDVLYVQDTLL